MLKITKKKTMTNKKMQYAHAPQNQIPVPAAWVYLNVSYGNRIGGNGLDSFC
jgi:hypothetical protein